MTETINLRQYWNAVKRHSQYDTDKQADGYALGLIAEAGECAGVVDKWLRGKPGYQTEALMKSRLIDELGDIIWYTAAWLSLNPRIWTMTTWDAVLVEPEKTAQISITDTVHKMIFHAYENGMFSEAHHAHAYKTIEQVAMLALNCGTTLQVILDQNVAKLNTRYAEPGSYKRAHGILAAEATDSGTLDADSKPEWVTFQENPQ